MSFPQRKRPTNRAEEVEQAKVIRWSHLPSVRSLMPQLRWLHHSPNGGKRDAFAGAQMKALGVKPGFPDLILPARSGDYLGLVIEMKSETGRASTEQKEWLAHLEDEGWSVCIARSAQEARSVLCRYLGISQDTAPALDD